MWMRARVTAGRWRDSLAATVVRQIADSPIYDSRKNNLRTAMNRFTCTLIPVLLLIFPLPVLAQITVSGSLLGFEGETMKQAHIVVMGGPEAESVLVQADDDGQFSFTLPVPGVYAFHAMGVHHEILRLPLVVQKGLPLQLDLQLAPKRITQDLDTLWVAVAESGELKKTLMDFQKDGIYVASVEAPADTLAYQIQGVKRDGETVVLAGTQAHAIILDRKGRFTDTQSDYFSLKESEGPRALIIFDPALLSGDSADPVLRSEPPEIADVFRVHLEVAEQAPLVSDAFSAFINQEIAHEEYRAKLANEHNAAKGRIATEAPGLARQWHLLRYFDALMAPGTDSLLARAALDEVPPTSHFWSYEARSRTGASNLFRMIAERAEDMTRVHHYVRQVIEGHTDPGVKAQFLMAAVILADREGDETHKWSYYEELQEGYGQTYQAEFIRREFSPALAAGNPIPEFAFVDLDNASITHSNQTMKGKVYLLDFWGTWCVPCIEKLPEMHEAYEEYKSAGFEILSVAVRDDRATLNAFRKERYPMPWPNTFVEDRDYESIAATFEITKFPRPILVDREGIIAAMDEELRYGKLTDVLEAALGRRE